MLQHFADEPQCIDQGFGGAATSQLGDGLVHNRFPEGGFYLVVDGDVAHDGESLRGWGDEDQHGISMTGTMHSEPMKLAFRGGKGIGDWMLCHEDTNFAGGMFFGARDLGDDQRFIETVVKPFGFHGRWLRVEDFDILLPAATCAAASGAAAASGETAEGAGR